MKIRFAIVCIAEKLAMLSVLLVVFSAVSLAAVSLVSIVDSATRAFVDSSPMLKHLLEIGIVGAVLGILSCAVLRLRNKDTGMTKAARRFFHAADVRCVWIDTWADSLFWPLVLAAVAAGLADQNTLTLFLFVLVFLLLWAKIIALIVSSICDIKGDDKERSDNIA